MLRTSKARRHFLFPVWVVPAFISFLKHWLWHGFYENCIFKKYILNLKYKSYKQADLSIVLTVTGHILNFAVYTSLLTCKKRLTALHSTCWNWPSSYFDFLQRTQKMGRHDKRYQHCFGQREIQVKSNNVFFFSPQGMNNTNSITIFQTHSFCFFQNPEIYMLWVHF